MKKIKKININKIIELFILLQPFFMILETFTFASTKKITFMINTLNSLFLIFLIFYTMITEKNKLKYLNIIFIIYIIFSSIIRSQTNALDLINILYFPILMINMYILKDKIRISQSIISITFLFSFFNTIILQFLDIRNVKEIMFTNIIFLLVELPIVLNYINKLKNKNIKIFIFMLFLIFIILLKNYFLAFMFLVNILNYSCLKLKGKRKKYFLALYFFIIVLILFIIKGNIAKLFLNKFNCLNEIKIYEINNIEKLFGINNYSKISLIKMDYFKIYFSIGLVGFLLYFNTIIIFLIKISRLVKKQSDLKKIILVNVLVIIISSFMYNDILTNAKTAIILSSLSIYIIPQKKKRLLFTAVNLDVGGIENALINLLNKINYEKYDVDLYLEEKKGIFINKINSCVNIIEFKVSNNKFLLLRKTINFIRQFNFYIFEYKNYDFSCCYATYSLSGNKIALKASYNSTIYVHSNYKYIYNTEDEIKTFFDKRKINKFRKILVVSNESRIILDKLYPENNTKIEVINNFVDIESVKSLSKKPILECKPKNKTLFVFIGRLEDKSKKISRAINLIDKLDNCELWIIGDGPDKEMYTTLASSKNKNKIKFCGQKANPYPYMNIADYIILTSDYEGFPVTYLEAIVLNKKIVTTIDVSDEFINIGKDYAYIVSKEENKMLEETQKILKDNSKRKPINLNQIQEKRMKNLENIFDEVV